MNKKKYLTNRLIKKKVLFSILKEHGINRISKESAKRINSVLVSCLKEVLRNAKQNMLINGRRTLQARDL